MKRKLNRILNKVGYEMTQTDNFHGNNYYLNNSEIEKRRHMIIEFFGHSGVGKTTILEKYVLAKKKFKNCSSVILLMKVSFKRI